MRHALEQLQTSPGTGSEITYQSMFLKRIERVHHSKKQKKKDATRCHSMEGEFALSAFAIVYISTVSWVIDTFDSTMAGSWIAKYCVSQMPGQSNVWPPEKLSV